MAKEVDQVTINMREVPASGTVQVLCRVRPEDDEDIRKAAKHLRLKLSEFTRLALINVARQINAA
jgi:uncharacterized protein (DUF1778 family)